MDLANARKKFARFVYRHQDMREGTLDDAQLKTRCPLDNGRHDCTPLSTGFIPNQLDKLPVELLVEVLLLLDIPSITRFRSLNRRSMAIVNSIHQYSAMIDHCPDIIRAIVSLQADGYDCRTLYTTLCTSQCPTCNIRFGNFLYLIDCRRVCYFCFTERVEYYPFTSYEAAKFFTPDANAPRKMTARKLLQAADPPSILSLPGWYCMSPRAGSIGYLRPKRIRLYDRRAVAQGPSSSSGSVRVRVLPKPASDQTFCEPKRFMGIISAPVLLDAGRQVDWGYFCRACREEDDEWEGLEPSKNARIKYTTEGMIEHMARFGRVKKVSMYVEYMHVSGE